MILVVLGLRGSQGILGIAKLGKRGGIGVVGIGQLGIGIAQSSLEASGGIDGGLIASVSGVQLDQLLVARRARGKGCLVVDSLKICLERLVVGKLGLGLDDLEVRIDDGFVGGLELLLGIGDTGDGSVIGGLGVVDRLLSAGEALEGLVCGGALGIGGLDLLPCVGQGLLLVGDLLLSICESRCGSGLCSLGALHLSLSGVVGLLGIIKRASLTRKICPCGIALGGKVLDRSSGVVIRLVGLVGFCLGGIASSLRLGLVSSSLLRLLLAFGDLCVGGIERGLGSGGFALGGIEVRLRRRDVDTLQICIGRVIGGLGRSGSRLCLLVLALGGVHVRVGRGIGIASAFLLIQCVRISRSSSPEVLLCLCQLILKLLQLLLLLLSAACIVGGINVVVQELLELGDSEIGLSVISAVIEYCYLGIGVLTATGRDADGFRGGIDDVEIVPTLMVDAVVVLVDVIGIISVAIEVIAILCDVLIECLLLLCVEAGVGPTECILGLAAGICAASAGKIFTVIPVAA